MGIIVKVVCIYGGFGLPLPWNVGKHFLLATDIFFLGGGGGGLQHFF
jgi:hypothetical protein